MMDFKAIQQGFMDYILDPNQPMPSDIEPRRMQVYRELFFNNVNGFVSSGFPVLKSLYEEDKWLELVQGFFANHQCHSPIFLDIAGEFLQYLQHEYKAQAHDPVFLLELAHYEWLELVIATIKTSPAQKNLTLDEITSAPLQLSVSAQVAQYQFDVQHISVDYQPIEPPTQPHFVCVYRDENDEVTFLKLNPLTAQVLALLGQYTSTGNSMTFEDIILWLGEQYPQMQADTLRQGLSQLLEQMVQKGVVVEAI